MKIEERKVSDLKFYPGNPRKISDEMLKSLKKSIQEFGVVDPLVVNTQNEVIGGNQRLKAIRDLGIEKVPVVVVDLSKSKEKALNLALNKISGEWDEELLKSFVGDIDLADLELTGFEDNEIESFNDGVLLSVGEEDKKDNEIIKEGDIFQLGKHRIMCADPENEENVSKLCGDEMVTTLGNVSFEYRFDSHQKYDPNKEDWHILMLSGGKDSLAVLILSKEKGFPLDEAVMVSGGPDWDWPFLSDHIKKIEEWWGKKVTILDISDKLEEGLEKYGFPTMFCRWCSGMKIEALEKYAKEKEKEYNVIRYIGIAYNEKKRLFQPQYKSSLVRFPLVEYKMKESDALKICYEHGFDFGGYYNGQNGRLGCWNCPLQRESSIFNLLKNHPDLFSRLEAQQMRSRGAFRLNGKTPFIYRHIFWERHIKGEQEPAYKYDSEIKYNKENSEALRHQIRKFLKTHTKENEKIFLPYGVKEFLLEAEETHRVAYMMESDKAICSDIVNWWESYTGKQAEKIG